MGWQPLALLTGGLFTIPSAWAGVGGPTGWAGAVEGMWAMIEPFLTIAIPVYFAIVLHEVAHGWMALRRGDPTAQEEGRLSINPLRHVDWVGTVLVPTVLSQFGVLFGWAKPVPVHYDRLRNPSRDMAWVAAATWRRLRTSAERGPGAAVDEAWGYEGSLGLAQADGVPSWVREMRGSLRSPEFRKAYAEALSAGKAEMPSFAGPADVLNRLLAVPSGEGGGRAGLVVPLMILSNESLGEMETVVSRLDEANQGRENPIHLVLAGTTMGVADRLMALKGARPYVHIIKCPVAPGGVLDPGSLAQGVETLKDFPAGVPVSWRVGLSPGIHVDSNSIEALDDVGPVADLKRALLEFLRRLLKGDRATPSDWGAAFDIVALVLRNA
jgi:hypothetical protein